MTNTAPLGKARRKSLNINEKQLSGTLKDAVASLRPAKPLYVLMPDVIERSARAFLNAFPGTAMYAVKTNPDPQVLRSLHSAGVNSFDVASLEEIRLVRRYIPGANLHFMHTVKAPEDIRAAYFEYGVRDFVLDHEEELFKILRETDLAQDLNLVVRMAVPRNDKAFIDFSEKFGASRGESLELLKKCRPVASSLGVSFHVGTQTTDANAYARAIAYCAEIIADSGIKVDALNVGGGFPVPYVGDEGICTVQDCVEAILGALEQANLNDIKLMAEPGRVLVAQGSSLVARVELRKGDLLYINDGVYGGLFDASNWLKLRYPVEAISCDRAFDGRMQDFRLAGPTCDSLDMMDGPFTLPADIGIGDWVVFHNAGAYSACLRSDFNGFGHAGRVTLSEKKRGLRARQ